MKERPIIFSGPMVRAILDGRKTQTRRAIRGVEFRGPGGYRNYSWDDPSCWGWADQYGEEWALAPDQYTVDHVIPCRFGAPGDRLWVRETFRQGDGSGPYEAHYRADEDEASGGPWKSSRFMPRHLSRITLEVTAVRVERVSSISTSDCYAEGIARPDQPNLGSAVTERENAVGAFRGLWDKINGKRAPWKSNPWVWVVEFRKL